VGICSHFEFWCCFSHILHVAFLALDAINNIPVSTCYFLIDFDCLTSCWHSKFCQMYIYLVYDITSLSADADFNSENKTVL
jgi:hypothetical protein